MFLMRKGLYYVDGNLEKKVMLRREQNSTEWIMECLSYLRNARDLVLDTTAGTLLTAKRCYRLLEQRK